MHISLLNRYPDLNHYVWSSASCASTASAEIVSIMSDDGPIGRLPQDFDFEMMITEATPGNVDSVRAVVADGAR